MDTNDTTDINDINADVADMLDGFMTQPDDELNAAITQEADEELTESPAAVTTKPRAKTASKRKPRTATKSRGAAKRTTARRKPVKPVTQAQATPTSVVEFKPVGLLAAGTPQTTPQTTPQIAADDKPALPRANYGPRENGRECFKCGCTASKVGTTRTTGDLVLRYRTCLECGQRRVTQELVGR